MSTTKDLIQARFDELRAEKAEIEAKSKPIRDERDQYLLQIETLNARVKELTLLIRQTEEPRIIELSREISTVAGALGGYSLSRGG